MQVIKSSILQVKMDSKNCNVGKNFLKVSKYLPNVKISSLVDNFKKKGWAVIYDISFSASYSSNF